jgi:DNA-binding MarR family transcriptional regulator
MKLEQALQTTHFRDAKHKVSLNILYSAWWLKSIMSKELKGFGITLEQYNVMRILKGKSPQAMCVKDIAGRMIEKGTNVPRIIDRLVDKKLVRRGTDAQDKRHTLMQLTPNGFDMLEQCSKKINLIADKIIHLTEKDAEQMNKLLEKMRIKE